MTDTFQTNPTVLPISVTAPDPSVRNMESESVQTFSPPPKKFPTFLLFLIPILVIVAVIAIYILLQARTMYQETIPSPSPMATPIASVDPNITSAPSVCLPLNEGYSSTCRQMQSKDSCLEVDTYNQKTGNQGDPDGFVDCQWKEAMLMSAPQGQPNYICPENGWVDCEPPLEGEREKACSDKAMDWYKINCSDFQGGAL